MPRNNEVLCESNLSDEDGHLAALFANYFLDLRLFDPSVIPKHDVSSQFVLQYSGRETLVGEAWVLRRENPHGRDRDLPQESRTMTRLDRQQER